MLLVLIAILSFVVVLMLILAPAISVFTAFVNSIVPDSTSKIIAPFLSEPPGNSLTLCIVNCVVVDVNCRLKFVLSNLLPSTKTSKCGYDTSNNSIFSDANVVGNAIFTSPVKTVSVLTVPVESAGSTLCISAGTVDALTTKLISFLEPASYV